VPIRTPACGHIAHSIKDLPHIEVGSHSGADTQLGYQISPRVGVYALFDHESNGGLAGRNEALNNIGIRVGYRF
jgi:hypothetical protein